MTWEHTFCHCTSKAGFVQCPWSNFVHCRSLKHKRLANCNLNFMNVPEMKHWGIKLHFWQGLYKFNKKKHGFSIDRNSHNHRNGKQHCDICLVIWFVSLHLGTTQLKVGLPVVWPLLQEVYGRKLQSLNFTEPIGCLNCQRCRQRLIQ